NKEDDGDRRGCRPGGERWRETSACDNHGDLSPHQFRRQCRQPIELIVGPAVFDSDVLALDKACVFQALAESTQPGRVSIGRRGVEEPDHRHTRLLRPRRERPCGYTAAEKCDEFPPPHGAYPKAKDHGTKYSRSGAVHRSNSGPLVSALLIFPVGSSATEP